MPEFPFPQTLSGSKKITAPQAGEETFYSPTIFPKNSPKKIQKNQWIQYFRKNKIIFLISTPHQ
jgi:hypothetical protein